MDVTTQTLLSAYLSLPVAMLAAAAALTWIFAARARAKAGEPIAQERPGARLRLFSLQMLHGAVFVAVVATRELPLVPATIAVLLGLLVVVLTPGPNDAVCGEDGVRRGFHGRRFEELEEWRLTGDHLRFRLFGEWTSAPLPPEHQPRIREKLLQVVPERESRFQD